ncbi:hypothetical protein JOL62DRAFT_286243 [Phyllosticta paracitricarpa]|uniref:Secreted protein n=1 Tax=Phyllosticta paracitricarpa TaxID=2016321 RepID=A0ABR1MW36_9PEZI
MRKKREKKQFPFFFFFFFAPANSPSLVSFERPTKYLHTCASRLPGSRPQALPQITSMHQTTQPTPPSFSLYLCLPSTLSAHVHTYIHTYIHTSSPLPLRRPPPPNHSDPSRTRTRTRCLRHVMPCHAMQLSYQAAAAAAAVANHSHCMYPSLPPSLSLSLSLFSTPARICIRDASSSYFVHLHTCMRHRLSRRCNACIRQ